MIPGLKIRLPEELEIYLEVNENVNAGLERYVKSFYYDTAISTSLRVFVSLPTVTDSNNVVFGSD